MSINLKKCIGCYSCALACKIENGTPRGVFLTKVLEQEEGAYPHIRRVFVPVLCNHCEKPACLEVCPSGATSQREDGIVLVDKDKCIGCRYCMMACPYNAREYLAETQGYYPNELTPFEQAKYAELQVGTVVKCNFCAARVDRGQEPACVSVCPTEARVFGDLNDPNSKVSRERRSSTKRLLPEYNTEPQVYYIEN